MSQPFKEHEQLSPTQFYDTYSNQVKSELGGRPDLCNAFDDLLLGITSKSISTSEAINRASWLFQKHPHLLQGFYSILPPIHDSPPAQNNESLDNAHAVTNYGEQTIANEDLLLVNSLKSQLAGHPDKYLELLKMLGRQQRGQISMTEVCNQVGKLLDNTNDSVGGHSCRESMDRQSLRSISSLTGVHPLWDTTNDGRHMNKRSSRRSSENATDSTTFFERTRKFFGNSFTYQSFLRLLDLYNSGYLDHNKLLDNATNYLLGNEDLYQEFLTILTFDPREVERLMAQAHMLEGESVVPGLSDIVEQGLLPSPKSKPDDTVEKSSGTRRSTESRPSPASDDDEREKKRTRLISSPAESYKNEEAERLSTNENTETLSNAEQAAYDRQNESPRSTLASARSIVDHLLRPSTCSEEHTIVAESNNKDDHLDFQYQSNLTFRASNGPEQTAERHTENVDTFLPSVSDVPPISYDQPVLRNVATNNRRLGEHDQHFSANESSTSFSESSIREAQSIDASEMQYRQLSGSTEEEEHNSDTFVNDNATGLPSIPYPTAENGTQNIPTMEDKQHDVSQNEHGRQENFASGDHMASADEQELPYETRELLRHLLSSNPGIAEWNSQGLQEEDIAVSPTAPEPFNAGDDDKRTSVEPDIASVSNETTATERNIRDESSPSSTEGGDHDTPATHASAEAATTVEGSPDANGTNECVTAVDKEEEEEEEEEDQERGNAVQSGDAANILRNGSDGAGTSYRRLPKSESLGKCSGRDDLCRQVLNDEYVSHPIWASEDSGFIASAKNQSEEILHRTEEERYNLDLLIDSACTTITLLEEISKQLKSLPKEKRATYRAPHNLGSRSSLVYRRVFTKMYDKERVDDIAALLQSKPEQTVPPVLERLRAKLKEWKTEQSQKNKHWRKLEAENYYKALDYRSNTIKNTDRRILSNKMLVTEIEALRQEQYDISGNRISYDPQLLYEFTNNDIHKDIFRLVSIFVESKPVYGKQLRERIYSTLESIVIPSLSHDGVPRQSRTHTEPSSEHASLLIVNDAIYCMYRLYQNLYERLNCIKKLSDDYKTDPYQTRARLEAEFDITVKKANLNGIHLDFGQGSCYDVAFGLIEKFVRSEIDQADFTNCIRYIFGLKGYVLCVADKVVFALANQVFTVVNDKKSQKLLALHVQGDHSVLASQAMCLTPYQIEAESLVNDESNLYRFSLMDGECSRQLTIYLLGPDDDRELVTQHKNYVESLTKPETSDHDTEASIHRPYLKRNLKHLTDADERELIAAHSGHLYKICRNTYKIFHVVDTEDVFIFKNSRKQKSTQNLRKFPANLV